jgi:hypothetical protein
MYEAGQSSGLKVKIKILQCYGQNKNEKGSVADPVLF